MVTITWKDFGAGNVLALLHIFKGLLVARNTNAVKCGLRIKNGRTQRTTSAGCGEQDQSPVAKHKFF
jgi:hypothetical protein